MTLSLYRWQVMSGDRAVSRHLTRRSAELEVHTLKMRLQRRADRLAYRRENDHFRDILAEMGDGLRIARCGR